MKFYVYVIIVAFGVYEQFIQTFRRKLLKKSRHFEEIGLDERL
jgi:uncharacterized membrane protein YqhA